jgi:hypothetical protein
MLSCAVFIEGSHVRRVREWGPLCHLQRPASCFNDYRLRRVTNYESTQGHVSLSQPQWQFEEIAL